MSQLFVPPTDFDQTKRIRRHQWCVDGAHAPSWVLPTPQAERFAKAAGYHGARNRGKSRRSTVETGTYPQKQKPLRQDPILVLSRGYPPSSSSKSLGEAVFIVVSLPPSLCPSALTCLQVEPSPPLVYEFLRGFIDGGAKNNLSHPPTKHS